MGETMWAAITRAAAEVAAATETATTAAMVCTEHEGE